MLVNRRLLAAALSAAALAALTGCANPGPPRPPSLHLPKPVRDLSAARAGATVELHFTLPTRTTDELPLKAATLTATFCRQLPSQPCIPIPDRIPVPTNGAPSFTWLDHLPAELTSGPARLLAYRLTLANPAGRSAAPSDPAWTAAGQAPDPVTALQITGSRQGTLLRWAAAPTPPGTQTLLERRNPSATGKNSDVWLDTNESSAATLDASAQPNIAYQYTAVRDLHLTLSGHAIDLRSDPSTTLTYTLHQVYPPAAPTGLLAASATTNSLYAVDLVWQPVDDPALAGYNVYRQPLTSPATPRQKLNSSPVTIPGFHDATAAAQTGYRYSVTAVGLQGNESDAVTTELEP
jgi:hypothetical protein